MASGKPVLGADAETAACAACGVETRRLYCVQANTPAGKATVKEVDSRICAIAAQRVCTRRGKYTQEAASAELEEDAVKRVGLAHQVMRGLRGPQEKLAYVAVDDDPDKGFVYEPSNSSKTPSFLTHGTIRWVPRSAERCRHWNWSVGCRLQNESLTSRWPRSA